MIIGTLLAGLLIFICSLTIARQYGAKAATASVMLAWGTIIAGLILA